MKDLARKVWSEMRGARYFNAVTSAEYCPTQSEKGLAMVENGMFVIYGMELSFMHIFFFSLDLIAVGGVCTLFRGHTLLRVFALTFGYGLGLCGVCLMCLAVYLLFMVNVINKANDTRGGGRLQNDASVPMMQRPWPRRMAAKGS